MRKLKIQPIITERDEASVERYFKDISSIPLIEDPSEEWDLAEKISEGDHLALQKLVNANLRFVVSVAKQYQNQGMPLADLINEGNIGLHKAAERFDHTKGFKFISYAVWWIRQAILHALAKQSRIVRLPLNRVGDLTKISKIQQDLEQKLEREPTMEEVALEMGRTSVELDEIQNIASKHMSIDITYKNKTGDDSSFLDIYENDEAEMPDDDMLSESLYIDLREALSNLPQREVDIITLYFGMNGKMKIWEISESFNIPQDRVRQLKEKGLRLLRKNKGTLQEYL